LDEQGVAAVLGGLRLVQRYGHVLAALVDPTDRDQMLLDILTNGQAFECLSDKAIDRLCERINCTAFEDPQVGMDTLLQYVEPETAKQILGDVAKYIVHTPVDAGAKAIRDAIMDFARGPDWDNNDRDRFLTAP